VIDQLYSEELVDHARHPLHFGQSVSNPTHEGHSHNASCGDACGVKIVVDSNDFISEISWTGNGCVVSMGAASLLSELLLDPSYGTFHEWKNRAEDEVLRLFGLETITPARRKCALILFLALQRAEQK